MQPSVLLDTSAFKALAAWRLEMAAKTASLYVSPFCFWELLTHLEDDEQYRRVKGNLMKLRHVEFLDDPHVEIYRLVLRSSDNVHTMVRDGDLIDSALAAVEDSESTQEFYKRFIQDESGQIHQIEGCVSRVTECLRIEEGRFQTYLREIVGAVRARHIQLTEAPDIDEGVRDLSRGWWMHIRDRVNETPAALDQFERNVYMYHSYLLQRAREYVARNTDSIDRNDFEDARLCLHLGLKDFAAVVTNDVGLQRCLKASLDVLSRMGNATHQAPQIWDVAAFIEGYGSLRLLPNKIGH